MPMARSGRTIGGLLDPALTPTSAGHGLGFALRVSSLSVPAPWIGLSRTSTDEGKACDGRDGLDRRAASFAEGKDARSHFHLCRNSISHLNLACHENQTRRAHRSASLRPFNDAATKFPVAKFPPAVSNQANQNSSGGQTCRQSN